MRIYYYIVACLLTVPVSVMPQKLAVLGSSTAYGYDSHPISDSSWVNLSTAWYRSIGQLTTLYNLAQPGTTTYGALPTSNPAGPGYPPIDTTHNVTAALKLGADVIIVSFPSNDIGLGYTIQSWLANLRLIRDSIVKAGKRYFISTSQPRSDFNMSLRQQLKQVRDSILAEFAFTLNFYDAVVDTSTLGILLQFDSGTGVHLNNAGHSALYEVVKAANIMSTPLALLLSGFTADNTPQGIRLQWSFANATPGVPASFFLQRSADGSSFIEIHRLTQDLQDDASTYSWTDMHPLEGKNFYRLHWQHGDNKGYSPIVSADRSPGLFASCHVSSLSPGSPTAYIRLPERQPFAILVYNSEGMILRRQFYPAAYATQIPITGLPAGWYLLKIIPEKANVLTRTFMTY